MTTLVTPPEPDSATTHLRIVAGPTPPYYFTLSTDDSIVGRDDDADITLSAPNVSRHHARLFSLGQIYMIDDLGSTNGTFVNGKRLDAPCRLEHGDRIGIGLWTLEFSLKQT